MISAVVPGGRPDKTSGYRHRGNRLCVSEYSAQTRATIVTTREGRDVVIPNVIIITSPVAVAHDESQNSQQDTVKSQRGRRDDPTLGTEAKCSPRKLDTYSVTRGSKCSFSSEARVSRSRHPGWSHTHGRRADPPALSHAALQYFCSASTKHWQGGCAHFIRVSEAMSISLSAHA